MPELRLPVSRSSRLGRFIARVLLWLPVCFAVWYVAGPILTVPLRWVATGVMRLGFGDLVSAVTQNGTLLWMETSLRAGHASTANVASGFLDVSVSTLPYTFGLPLLAALILAAPSGQRMRQLAIGYAALLPFHAWSVASDALKQLAITLGPGIASQTGFIAWQREVIAFAYQFGTLMLPTVVPVVVWVMLNRRFVEGLLEAPAPLPQKS